MRKNLLKYFKQLVVKNMVPSKSDFPFEENGLPELMEGYQSWYKESTSPADFYKNVKKERLRLLENALSGIPDPPHSIEYSNLTESILVKAFLYLFPPQSSITLGTWQMRL